MRRTLLCLPVILAAACAGTSPGTGPAASRRAASPATPSAVKGPPALWAVQITEVPAGTFGPYVGQTPDGALIVWAPLAGQRRSWMTLPVATDGTPRGQARRIADAPAEIGLAAVRGTDDGLVAVVNTRRTGLGENVELTLLRANGELVAAPRPLAEIPSQALWVEVSAAKDAFLVMWAVKNGAAADLRAIAVPREGRGDGEQRALATGVSAWQALPFAGGTALAVVKNRPAPSAGGSVELQLFGPDGRARGEVLAVSKNGRPALDLDLAALGDSLIVAWSDAREGENRVYRALVDASGRLRVPEGPLTTPLGEQALVRVLARRGATRAFVVWENPQARRGDLRAFDIASLGPDGRAHAERGRVLLESDEAVPELAAVGDGIAALTLSPACEREARACEADLLPTFVRFGSNLVPVASEPLRLEPLQGGSAELAWGLTCGEAACFSLAALGEAPAPVWVARLERRSDHFVPAGERLGGGERPRFRENRVIAETDALAATAALTLDGGTLVAHLSDFDPTTPWVRLKKPAPDGRFDPLRARLVLTGVGADGAPLAPPAELSLRAHSLGGVALTQNPAAPGDPFVAWAGVDAGQPQVFLTLVTPQGARKTQRMLTRKPGDKSDIAATPVSGGWLVGWVDERDRDPEVYAARVDGRLNRVGIEQRLTKTAGPATQLTLAPSGDGALLAWADARQPELPGEADIYLARIAGRDASLVEAEKVVMATRGHSFSPVLRALGDGFLLAWLERGEPESGPSGSLMLATLDAAGAVRGDPERVALDGDPAVLALECAGDACRVVVSQRLEQAAELRAGVWRTGAPLALKRLTRLGSKRAAGVSLGLTGETLVFADADGEGRFHLRRALIDW